MTTFRSNRFLWQREKPVRKKILWLLIAVLGIKYLFLLPSPLFQVPYSTTVYDRNGRLMGARIASDEQWRFPPGNDTLNSKYVTALVMYEDKRFFRHMGVDILAFGRAVRQNIQRKKVVSGASTLTMQTVRLMRNRPRTMWEKAVEMVWATRLELKCNKNEILRLYAAHAPFGGNVIGLEAASWRYFSHGSDELSWAESALLAVLPNSPALMHPGKNNRQLKSKRDQLLRKLKEQHYLNEAEYELAVGEELPSTVHPLPQLAPHLTAWFHLHEKGEQIRSTIDADLQLQVEQTAERWMRQLEQEQIHNLAILVADVRTNQVAAYYGNTPHDRQSGHVDIIRSPRSSGSILKPFLYAASLQDGVILPHTLLADVPVNLNGFCPHNFNYKYDGAVPADKALSRSLNVPMVLLLKKYGVSRFHIFLRKAGISTLDRSADDYGLSLILGGAEVSLWDLAQAYNAMANAIRQKPQKKLQISMDRPAEKWDNPPFSAAAAWLTFDALKELHRPEEIDWKEMPSMQTVAWKTGTSFGFRDAWAVGATPRHVVAVWVGNATGEGNSALIGAQTAGPLMFDIFNFLPRSRWFSRPDDKNFVKAEVCRASGHLKGRFCPESDTLLICPKGLQSSACPYHKPSKWGEDTIGTVFALPPAWAWYYQCSHPEYAAQEGLDHVVTEDSPMQFLYPTGRSAHVTIPKQWDGSPGKITLELIHKQSNAVVFWHVDGNYMGSTQFIHKFSLHLERGSHRITAIDETDNRLELQLFVE